MEKADEIVLDTTLLLAEEVTEISTTTLENQKEHRVEKCTFHPVVSLCISIAALAFLYILISIMSILKHREHRVIMGCLVVLSLLSFQSRAWGHQGIVGLNNPKAKKNRWLHVANLNLMFVVSVWLVSSSTFLVKLHLTAIMLADPLTFAIHQVPKLQQRCGLGWGALVELNEKFSVNLLKSFALIFFVLFKVCHESIEAGVYVVQNMFLCYLSIIVTFVIYGLQSALSDMATQHWDEEDTSGQGFWDLYNLQTASFSLGVTKKNADLELQPAAQVTSPPAASADENLPIPAIVPTLKERMQAVLTCLCAVAFGLISIISFISLIEASDMAQSNNTLRFIFNVPQGFFSIILVPTFLFFVEFVLDIWIASQQLPGMELPLWSSFIVICLVAAVMNSLLLLSLTMNDSNALSYQLISVPWFASILKQYAWKVSKCQELFITAYILLMIWCSIAWATVFGLPVFVALFIF